MSADVLLGNKSANVDYRTAKASDFPHQIATRFPLPYPCLRDPELTRKLSSVARSQRHSVKSLKRGVYSATLQPCTHPAWRNQDRLAVQEWNLGPGGTWVFAAVFDGHSGHECVDYVSEHLPSYVRKALEARVQDRSRSSPSPDEISALLQTCLVELDNALGSGLRDLFPEQMDDMTDAQVKALLEGTSGGVKNMTKFLRCMCGAVVVAALVDKSTDRLWVANLGDCQAVLASRVSETGWDVRSLANDHNARNPAEVERIRLAHPNEDECVLNDRLLGKTIPTRGLGDWDEKFPAEFLSRVYRHFPDPPISFRYTSAKLLARIKTPPYMSSVAEVSFVQLEPITYNDSTGKTDLPRFLLLATDGLLDICQVDEATDPLRKKWVDSVARAQRTEYETGPIKIIRDALGGDDMEKVSMNVLLPMTELWMDDTTIIVMPLL